MSISQGLALAAVAAQLAEALAAYDAETTALLANDRDLDSYSRVSARMDQLRLYANAMPQLGSAWAELLIRHFELTHGLWRAHRDPALRGALVDIRANHVAAIQVLQRRLIQSVPRH
jgi:hypothetical protein